MAHDSQSQHQETLLIHAAQKPDPITGAVVVPVSLATTFAQPSPGVCTGFEYSRTGNPTRKVFEECLAAVEGAKYGLAFASGSAALMTILAMYGPGDHAVSVDDVYGGTQRGMLNVARPSQGMEFTLVDTSDMDKFAAAFTPRTKMAWLETPTNPTLKVSDIRRAAEITHAHGAKLFVDNTFASPYLQSPISLGADAVVHSGTKYIGGHSDVVIGAVCTNDKEIYDKLRYLQNAIGAVPSPFECYLALRGMKTLHLRMKAHCENAQRVAEFLESHPKVERVLYPGLASHPQHAIAASQMRGFGGMVTFFVKGGLDQARTFLESVKLFTLAESLGCVEGLVEHPAIMTHASVPPETRRLLGISDTLIRLSVGVEHIDDILADLAQALDKIVL